MGRPHSIPNELAILARAVELKETGMSWRAVAAELDAGVGAEWLQRRLVPGYAEKKNA